MFSVRFIKLLETACSLNVDIPVIKNIYNNNNKCILLY